MYVHSICICTYIDKRIEYVWMYECDCKYLEVHYGHLMPTLRSHTRLDARLESYIVEL